MNKARNWLILVVLTILLAVAIAAPALERLHDSWAQNEGLPPALARPRFPWDTVYTLAIQGMAGEDGPAIVFFS